MSNTFTQITFTVTEGDVKATHCEAGIIERALYRSVINRFPQVSYVHEGLGEIGFVVDGQTYECRLSKELRDQFDAIVYGQCADLPSKFTCRFKRL